MASGHKAEKEAVSMKKHGDPMGQPAKSGEARSAAVDPIPAPESGGHEKSHAAHVGEAAHEHTHRAGEHPGAWQGEVRQPPQNIARTGKEHRKQ